MTEDERALVRQHFAIISKHIRATVDAYLAEEIEVGTLLAQLEMVAVAADGHGAYHGQTRPPEPSDPTWAGEEDVLTAIYEYMQGSPIPVA